MSKERRIITLEDIENAGELTYDELRLPHYINNNNAIKLSATVKGEKKTLNLSISDLAFAIELAGLNSLWLSDTGKGKTQLMTDIIWHHYAGDNVTGHGNWGDGRMSFEITDLFERTAVDLSKGVYDSETATQLKEERLTRLFFGLDEITLAPGPKQSEFFDLADGKYTYKGVRRKLGLFNYAIFMATGNINKIGDDFKNVFELSRALWNRAHVTVDLDHLDFRPTPADEILIEVRKANPQVDVPPPNDLTDKILKVNREIRKAATTLDPNFVFFRFLIGRSLNYCANDTYNDKGAAFPMKCPECKKTDPTTSICSTIKSSSDRTFPAVKTLAYALGHIAQLKFGEDTSVDYMDLFLQAFRFTTYHGNLNELTALESYYGRKQAMMDDVVAKLYGIIEATKDCRAGIIEQGHSNIIQFETKDGSVRMPYNEASIEKLTKGGIAHKTVDLKEILKENDMGTDWVDAYVKEFGGPK